MLQGDMWGQTNSDHQCYEVSAVFSFQGDARLTRVIQNAREEYIVQAFCQGLSGPVRMVVHLQQELLVHL